MKMLNYSQISGVNGMVPAVRKIISEELSIVALDVSKSELIAKISDGRTISVPIAWFSRLANASIEELGKFEISASGYGVHWPDLDEDISIKTFLNP